MNNAKPVGTALAISLVLALSVAPSAGAKEEAGGTEKQPSARKEPDTLQVMNQIQAAFSTVQSLKYMNPGEKYELDVGGYRQVGHPDDFLRRRNGAEIIESKLSSGCGDYAVAFAYLLADKGLETLIIDSVLVSLNSLESRFSGHVVVAVHDLPGNRWVLADPTAGRVISENWSREDKMFCSNGRFWIGYCGSLKEYPVHSPGELRNFYARTLKSIPADYWNEYIRKFVFKIDPSLIGSDGKLLAPRLPKLAESQRLALKEFNIHPKKKVTVLLVKGEDDSTGILTHSDLQGWVCTVGLQSACSLSFIDYMQRIVADKQAKR